MVFSGLVTAWRLAGWPTRRSPSSVKATIDGVVRAPSAFSMTLGALPSITATQELVVPRSMPMTLPMCSPLFSGKPAGPFGARLSPAGHPRGLSADPLTTRFAAVFGCFPHIGGALWAARHGPVWRSEYDRFVGPISRIG